MFDCSNWAPTRLRCLANRHRVPATDHEPQRAALIGLTRYATLLAPGSVPWEVGNGLVAGFHRGRLTARDVHEAWRSFERILQLIDVRIVRALSLAERYGLYAYDAHLLEVARAQRAPLLTLDRRLLAAARDLGIELPEGVG
jgi:predicted nucleic acid-binding protein